MGLLLNLLLQLPVDWRTWVQCISEGQINEPTQDDAHSTESGGTETSVLVEGNTRRIRS